MLGVLYLFNNENFIMINGLFSKIINVNYIYLLIAVFFVLLLSFFYRSVLKNDFNNMFNIPVTICINKKNITTNALLDTGNNLKDPITRVPVIVTDFNVIKDVLPLSIQNLYFDKFDLNLNELSKINDTKLYKRLRIIPFNSVGKNSGMMLGIVPDEIIVNQKKPIRLKKVIVGLSDENLSSDGDYGVLLHPDLLYGPM